MSNREEVLKDVMQKNPKLLQKMIDCPEPSKLVLLLKEYDIDVTEIEASKILRALNFYDITSDINNGDRSRIPQKLDDKDLEKTSGGLIGEAAFIYEGYKLIRSIINDEKKYREEKKKQSESA